MKKKNQYKMKTKHLATGAVANWLAGVVAQQNVSFNQFFFCAGA